MTDTYKVLGQALTGDLALDGTTIKETVVYEVPAGTKASVSAIEITNSDTASQTYKIAFVPNADVSTAITSIGYESGVIQNIFIATRFAASGAYSIDGINWTQLALPEERSWYLVTFADGKFVAFAFGSYEAAYSIDGLTWSLTTQLSYDTVDLVAYGDGKFIVMRSDPNAAFYDYSTDGINWLSTTNPLPGYFYKRALTYGNDKFVLIGNSNSAAYSTDGITWTLTTIPGNEVYWLSTTYGNNKFVVVGDSNSAVYSTDGITWAASTLPSNQYWSSVTYGEGKFVAVALNSDTAAYSTDGITWTASTLPSVRSWNSVTYGDGKFIVVSGFGSAAYSSDGITWAEITLPGGVGWTSVSSGYVDTTQTLQQSIPQSLNKHIAIYNKSIASGETHEIKGGVTLSAGDQIRVYSTSNEIITNVYGVEIE